MLKITIETVRLGARCQMVLPARVRKGLGVKEGDELLIMTVGGTAVIVPKPKNYADALLGLDSEIWKGIDADEYLKGERDSWLD